MKNYRILCMIDFSEETSSLLHYAVQLAAAYRAELRVLHVYFIPDAYQGEVFIPKEALAEYEAQCHADFRKLHEAAGPQAAAPHFVVRQGDVLEEANRLIAEAQIDLLLVGNRGGGILVNILGNHTLKFIYHAKCPVLSVPSSVTFHPFKRVLLATDWEDTPPRKVDQLIRILRPLKASLDVLHIAQKQEQAFREVNRDSLSLGDIPHTFYYLWESHIEQGLQQHITEHGNDLLVMIPRHHRFFDRLFQKSITRQMGFHARVPLLTVHA